MRPSPPSLRKARMLGVSIAVVVAVVDQITKEAILAAIAVGERVPVIPGFFDLTHARNPGGVWSVGADLGGPLRTAIFLALPIAITSFAIWYSWMLPPRALFRQSAIALVVGGAIGNLFDRLFRNPPEVVDFLLAHWRGRYWPAFNVADSAICVGVAILLIASFTEDDEEAGEAGAEPPAKQGEAAG